MILAEIQRVIVYRSQLEADAAEWWYNNPAAILWAMGLGLAVIIIAALLNKYKR
jgi:hypothetical protein